MLQSTEYANSHGYKTNHHGYKTNHHMNWNCCHIYYHLKSATHLLKLNMVLSVNLVCRQKHILSWVMWSEAPTMLVLHIIYGFPRRKMCSQSFPDITQLVMVSSHTLVLTITFFDAYIISTVLLYCYHIIFFTYAMLWRGCSTDARLNCVREHRIT